MKISALTNYNQNHTKSLSNSKSSYQQSFASKRVRVKIPQSLRALNRQRNCERNHEYIKKIMAGRHISELTKIGENAGKSPNISVIGMSPPTSNSRIIELERMERGRLDIIAGDSIITPMRDISTSNSSLSEIIQKPMINNSELLSVGEKGKSPNILVIGMSPLTSNTRIDELERNARGRLDIIAGDSIITPMRDISTSNLSLSEIIQKSMIKNSELLSAGGKGKKTRPPKIHKR